MKTVKPQKLTTVPFVEGGNCNQILMQLTKACKKILFNISGTIKAVLAGMFLIIIGSLIGAHFH